MKVKKGDLIFFGAVKKNCNDYMSRLIAKIGMDGTRKMKLNDLIFNFIASSVYLSVETELEKVGKLSPLEINQVMMVINGEIAEDLFVYIKALQESL